MKFSFTLITVTALLIAQTALASLNIDNLKLQSNTTNLRLATGTETGTDDPASNQEDDNGLMEFNVKPIDYAPTLSNQETPGESTGDSGATVVPLKIQPTVNSAHAIVTESTTDEATSTSTELTNIPTLHFTNELNESLAEKIAAAETDPSELINPVASQLNKITLEVTEVYDGLLYTIKPTVAKVTWGEKENATTSEEVISLPIGKRIAFTTEKHLFTVDDKNSFDYSKLIGSADNPLIGIDLKTSSTSPISHIQAKPGGDCLKLYFHEDPERSIDVCADFIIGPDGVSLTDKIHDFTLKTNPDIIFDTLANSAAEEDSKVINGTLRIEDGKPVYHFHIEEQHKFLWLMPVTVRADLKINAEDDSLFDIEYDWLGLFFKNKGYASHFKFAPDLIITSMSTEPVSVHTKDKLMFKGEVKNVGNDYASASYTGPTGPSSIDLYFGDDLKIDSQETGFFLAPGETGNIYLEWSAILCNVPVTIKLDPENKIEELNEDNNTWSWTTRCAPTDAPDLVADPITYDNNYKRIGSPNTIHLTFRNQGTQPSPEQTSFYYFDGLSSSILVPALNPGASWSTTRSVTPKSCASVRIEIDTSDIVDEIEEGNNIAYEHPDIINSCEHRPDLFVDHVWWTAGGYTAGDIHAGEQMWFEYTVKNDPVVFSNHDACLSGFAVALQNNGTTVATENLGWIGCVDDYAYNHPDYWKRIGHFTYTPKCNGEHLTIKIDPNNAVSESQEWNNTWTMDIVCTMPPPSASPTP